MILIFRKIVVLYCTLLHSNTALYYVLQLSAEGLLISYLTPPACAIVVLLASAEALHVRLKLFR